jgi:cation transport regulator ChaC
MSECQLVFAYGSNMDIAQMRERCPDSKHRFEPVVAKAEGWKLCFPRYSDNRKGGVGSIIRAPGEVVRGIVYQIVTSRDLKRLDTREGIFAKAYHRERLVVKTLEGKDLETWTYVAVPQDAPPRHYAPAKEYLALYICGAEQFSIDVAYVESLRKISTSD